MLGLLFCIPQTFHLVATIKGPMQTSGPAIVELADSEDSGQGLQTTTGTSKKAQDSDGSTLTDMWTGVHNFAKKHANSQAMKALLAAYASWKALKRSFPCIKKYTGEDFCIPHDWTALVSLHEIVHDKVDLSIARERFAHNEGHRGCCGLGAPRHRMPLLGMLERLIVFHLLVPSLYLWQVSLEWGELYSDGIKFVLILVICKVIAYFVMVVVMIVIKPVALFYNPFLESDHDDGSLAWAFMFIFIPDYWVMSVTGYGLDSSYKGFWHKVAVGVSLSGALVECAGDVLAAVLYAEGHSELALSTLAMSLGPFFLLATPPMAYYGVPLMQDVTDISNRPVGKAKKDSLSPNTLRQEAGIR